MKKQLINFDQISFSYGDCPILQDASFVVEEQDFTAVIGPNGSGKTTGLHLLMGFLQQQKGRVAKEQSLSIGFVPQTPQLDKQFPVTALDVVLMGCVQEYTLFGGTTAKGKEKALEALKKVELEGFASHPFGALSGGQAQRVLIARALASSPQLLICDEPTANVDSASEHVILNILKETAKEAAVLLVTHDFHTVTNLVNKVLLFQNKTITTLAPKDLCNHYAMGVYHEPKEQT